MQTFKELIIHDCYVSKVERLTLNQYVTTMNFLCESQHKECCKKECKSLAKVAIKILEDGFMLLKDTFLLCSPTVTYTALHARRKDNSKKLLQVAETDAKRERLKFVAVKAGGLSSTHTEQVYGFRMENAWQRKVFKAMEHAQMIKESTKNIAKLKDRALISSLGFDVTEDEDETTSSSSDDDNDQFNKSVDECDILDEGVLQEKVNEYNLLKLLNWYQFAMVLRDKMNGMMIETFNQVLHDFGDKLPLLELSQHEKRITEQSRQAYIAANKVQEREKAAEKSIIVSSDSGDNEAELLATEGIPDCLIGNGVTEILRKRAAIQRKAVRKSKAKIAAQRFLKRHKSKRVSKIISECEGIGEAVEGECVLANWSANI